MKYYYLTFDKKTCGPHTLETLCDMVAQKQLSAAVLVAKDGDAAWRPLLSVANENGLQLTMSDVPGACPSCNHRLSLMPDATLPHSCPNCGRAFRPAEGRENNLWYNFTLALRQYVKFSGRATRQEYWSFILFSNVMTFVANLIIQLLCVCSTSIEIFSVGLMLLMAACVLLVFYLILPSYAVMVRRLHDVGWSGKWVLAMVVSFLFVMVGFVGMMVSLDYEADAFTNAFTDASVSWAVIAGVSYVVMALISMLCFIVSLFDSQRGPNKYGPSRKYPMG